MRDETILFTILMLALAIVVYLIIIESFSLSKQYRNDYEACIKNAMSKDEKMDCLKISKEN